MMGPMPGCKFDTDGDGNCAAHPNGCVNALLDNATEGGFMADEKRQPEHGFDGFAMARWPTDVPTDCTKLVNAEDCLERNLPSVEWCESCRVYNNLALAYDGQNDTRYAKRALAEGE